MVNPLLYQARGHSGIFRERVGKQALPRAERSSASGLENQPCGDSAFSVQWALKIFSHREPHTGSSNDTTLPEAVISYKDQRQAGKAGEEGAYRDQAEEAAEDQDFGQEGRQMPITEAAKGATLEAKK